MRRRPRWFLLAVVLVASLPVIAVADPPDASDRGGAVDPHRQREGTPAPMPDPDAAARGARRDPARDPAPSTGGPEADREAGAGSAEPDPGDGRREEGQEAREQEQHRKWVESIWTSP